MASRGNHHDRNPPGGWGPPYDREPYQRLPPCYGGSPPPYYNDYDGHSDGYFDDHPSQFYEDDVPYDDFERQGLDHAPSFWSGQRGRGRGQNGTGRGKSYPRGQGNSTKQFPKNGAPQKQRTNEMSKPAWLSQQTTTISTSSDHSITPTKPAWLSHPLVSTASSTSPSKPAWLTQTVITTSTSNASTSKPAWPTQTPVTIASVSSSSSKPAWLTQTPLRNSNSNSTSSKPSWMSQPVNNTVTSSSNALPNKPSWMAQPSSLRNTNTPPKPAWLSQPLAPVQPNKNSDTLPTPPPPPLYPPTQQQTPFTTTPTPQANQGKPKKAKAKTQGEITVAGPNNSNFISFKNSLQEYCQKKGLAVPVYRSFKSSYGYSATVELSDGKKFHKQSIQKDKKEAEQFAALETLKSLGLLPMDTNFVNPPKPQLGAKRGKMTPATVAKKLKLESTTPCSTSPNYKCQLNEFCQKFHLPVPTYETTHNGTGFMTTLVYNKKVYMSTAPQATKKDAEQNVAQLALSKVNQAPPPSEPQKGPVVYPNFVVASNTPEETTVTTSHQAIKQELPNPTVIPVRSVQDLAANNITPAISYKNKLQEICQKKKTELPKYESTRDDKFYSCKVTIHGQVFTATGCKTKKGSEQSAARVALQTLGLLNE